ncbi:MAG: hypothetical protein HY710_12555 [Candidatus Latescibacteria bacterium]|nr:hypothetical protein [Candidatus Latescibacterota bacterium]
MTGILPLIALGAIIEAACLEIVRIGDLRTSLATVWVGDYPVIILVFWLPFLAAFLTYLVVVDPHNPPDPH